MVLTSRFYRYIICILFFRTSSRERGGSVMKTKSDFHKHICMTCSRAGNIVVWGHDASECYVPHPTAKNCQNCAGVYDAPGQFRHDHVCDRHKHIWSHDDKACLLGRTKATEGHTEVRDLTCPGLEKTGVSVSSEGGGTAQMSLPKNAKCPGCGTQAQLLAEETDFLGHDEYICPECGREFGVR